MDTSSMPSRKINLLIGVTGAVAAVKLPELIKVCYQLMPHASIRVIVTQSSTKFIEKELKELDLPIYRDNDEWREWESSNHKKILHLDIRDWADMLVIAPLDALTLAKIANGFNDNLLTSVVRAWFGAGISECENPLKNLEFEDVNIVLQGSSDNLCCCTSPECTEFHHRKMKPVLLVPSMDVAMWHSPITKDHLHYLSSKLGFHIALPKHNPVSPVMEMMETNTIGAMVSDLMKQNEDK